MCMGAFWNRSSQVRRATRALGVLCLALVTSRVEEVRAESDDELPRVSEEQLGPVPAGKVLALEISPDALRIAWVEGRGSKFVVVVDGKPGLAYDAIGAGSLRFSTDSRQVAYAASTGSNGFFVVVDGNAGPEYDLIGANTQIFSSDGKRVAYVAKKGDKSLLGG